MRLACSERQPLQSPAGSWIWVRHADADSDYLHSLNGFFYTAQVFSAPGDNMIMVAWIDGTDAQTVCVHCVLANRPPCLDDFGAQAQDAEHVRSSESARGGQTVDGIGVCLSCVGRLVA